MEGFISRVRHECAIPLPLIPKGAFVVIREMTTVLSDREGYRSSMRGWSYTSRWNGSYHDALYTPYIIAWAKGRNAPIRARAMMREALGWFATQKHRDPSVARFEARRQVRPGD